MDEVMFKRWYGSVNIQITWLPGKDLFLVARDETEAARLNLKEQLEAMGGHISSRGDAIRCTNHVISTIEETFKSRSGFLIPLLKQQNKNVYRS